jgi:hypothetical protein
MTTPTSSGDLHNMTDSVARLHLQLKETQESMQRIYERANLLKKRVSEKKEQSYDKKDVVTDDTETQQLRDQVTQLETKIKILENEKRDEYAEQKQIRLVEQNRVLRETLSQHEAAVILVAQRCTEQLNQERTQGQERLEKLQHMLQNERGENIRLLSENAQLKSLLQKCVDGIREAANQRETEMMEIDTTLLSYAQENENLRAILQISSEEKIEPPPPAILMAEQLFNPKQDVNAEPIVPVDNGKID